MAPWTACFKKGHLVACLTLFCFLSTCLKSNKPQLETAYLFNLQKCLHCTSDIGVGMCTVQTLCNLVFCLPASVAGVRKPQSIISCICECIAWKCPTRCVGLELRWLFKWIGQIHGTLIYQQWSVMCIPCFKTVSYVQIANFFSSSALVCCWSHS